MSPSRILPAVALVGLVACTNSPPRSFSSEPGVRYATGTTGDGSGDDTGGETGDTDGGDGSPEIIDAAGYFEDSTADTTTIIVDLVYADSANDIEGGTVYFIFIDADSNLPIVAADAVDYSTQASVSPSEATGADGQVSFRVGPVATDATYTISQIIIQDTAGHNSNEAAQEIRREEL